MKTNMNSSLKSTALKTNFGLLELKSNLAPTDFSVPVLYTKPSRDEIQPPLHVWEKIARKLDEQDKKKNKIPMHPDRVFFS